MCRPVARFGKKHFRESWNATGGGAKNLHTVRICWAEVLVGRGAGWYM